MHIFKILPLTALLLATPALADGVVCPSPEPLMEHLCATAEHSSKMFAALRAGNWAMASQESQAANTNMHVFSITLNLLASKLENVRIEAMRNTTKP
jgi:hypothetical protein